MGQVGDRLTLIENVVDSLSQSNLGEDDSLFLAQQLMEVTALSFQLGDYDKAESSIRQAINILEQLEPHNTSTYSIALNRLSVVKYYQSYYLESFALANRVLNLERSLNTEPNYKLYIALNNLAAMHLDFDNYARALELNSEALHMAETLVSRDSAQLSDVFNVFHIRSRVFDKLNMQYRALEEASKLEEILESNPDIYSEYHYGNMVDHFLLMDSLNRAKEYMKKAWEHYERLGNNNPDDEAQLLLMESSIMMEEEKYREAREMLDRSIRNRNAIGSDANYFVAVAHASIAGIFKEQEHFVKALEELNKVTEIVETVFGKGHTSWLQNNLSRIDIFQSLDQGDSIRITFEECLTEMNIFMNESIDWPTVPMHKTALNVLSQYLSFVIQEKDRYTKKQVLKIIQILKQYIEKYVGFYMSVSNHVSLSDQLFKTYDDIVVWAYDNRHDIEDGNNFLFSNIQESKLLLSRLIDTDVEINSFGNVPDSIVQQDQHYKSELRLATYQMSEKPDFENRDLYSQLERKYEVFKLMLQRQYPKYYESKYQFVSPDLQKIQSTLNTNEVLLSFNVGEGAVILQTISRDDVVVKKIPVDLDSLRNLSELLIHAMNYPSPDSEWRPAASKMFKLLLSDLQIHWDNLDRIYLQADDILHRLSFDVLFWNEFENVFPIVEVINISDLTNKSQKKSFSDLLAFIPGFIGADNHDAVLPQPNSFNLGNDLRNLFSAIIYEGKLATESAFKSQSIRNSILHIATHAYLQQDNPLHSYLLLHRDDANDGRIEAREIYDIPIGSDVVVLSACRTSDGLYRDGMGVNSLARAMIYSGCKTVVSSQWDVDEQTNSRILELFYNKISKGANLSSSLSEAKSDFLHQAPEELRHPFYWAGVGISGVDFPIRRNSVLALTWKFVLVFVMGYILVRHLYMANRQ